MKSTKNPSAIYSQSQIQKAFLVLLKKYSYGEISVKEIMYEAKVARKTFYRNFESKQDVLDSIVKNVLYEYGEKISALVEEDLMDFFDIIFDVAKKEKAIFRLLVKQNLFHLVQEEASRYIPILHEDECGDCEYFSGLSENQTAYVIAFNIGAVWNVVRKWIEEGMKTSEQEIKEGLVKFLAALH